MTGAHKYRRADDRFDAERFLAHVARHAPGLSRRDIAIEADVNLSSLLRAFSDGNALTLILACRLADWAHLDLDAYRRIPA